MGLFSQNCFIIIAQSKKPKGRFDSLRIQAEGVLFEFEAEGPNGAQFRRRALFLGNKRAGEGPVLMYALLGMRKRIERL